MSKFGQLIVRPRRGEAILDLATRPIVTENAAELPVVRHILIDKKLVPETILYQAMHSVDALQTRPPHYQKPHSHDFVETYIFLGSGPDFTGLTAEVVFEDESHEIVAPASVYIPPGLVHRYRMVSGSGILIVTALKSEYGYRAASA